MDTSKFVSARDPEVWSSMKYRPIVSGDYKIVQENPDFIVEGSVIPTDRILYTALTKPESMWITENCSENVFDENTREGYLLLKDDVTELTGNYNSGLTIFNNTINTAYYNVLSIVIPTQITRIGSDSFTNYYGLTSVTIPDSVTSIGSYAFQYCKSLSTIEIPNTVKSIESNAFSHCTSLTGELIIPNSVESLGGAAFGGCVNLTSLTISESINTIPMNAFHDCTGLVKVIIPNSVSEIIAAAFKNCNNLLEVICNAIEPPTLQVSNNFVAENDTLYVPAESVAAYKATNWNDVFNENIQAIR